MFCTLFVMLLFYCQMSSAQLGFRPMRNIYGVPGPNPIVPMLPAPVVPVPPTAGWQNYFRFGKTADLLKLKDGNDKTTTTTEGFIIGRGGGDKTGEPATTKDPDLPERPTAGSTSTSTMVAFEKGSPPAPDRFEQDITRCRAYANCRTHPWD